MKRKTKGLFKALVCCSLAMIAGGVAHAQYVTGFENPPFTSGLINGQDLWASPAAGTNAKVLTSAEITNALTSSGLTVGTVVHGGDQAFFLSGADASGG